jgi:glycosyltransferase involved in cell wall biosynthesis
MGMPAADSWGGPASSEPPFVEALRGRGHEVVEEDFVYGDKDRPTPFLSRVSRVARTAAHIRSRVHAGNFDLVHLNSAFDRRTILRDSFTIFAMGRNRPKVFIKMHGSFPEQLKKPGPFFGKLMRYLIDNVDGWGYHTTPERLLFEEIGFDTNRFHLVRNAITVHLDLPEGYRREQKDAGEVIELLFVSRLVPLKGLTILIEACAILRSRGVRFRLTCVGEGEARRDAEDAVGRHGLGRVVTFTGHVPEDAVRERMLASDIFVFPTLYSEGFPNVLFKAMALGMPAISTRIRGADDYLDEPGNCLFAEKTAESLADRIEQLIADKELRERMSANNLEYGKTLGPEEIAKEFEAVYTKVIGRDLQK